MITYLIIKAFYIYDDILAKLYLMTSYISYLSDLEDRLSRNRVAVVV